MTTWAQWVGQVRSRAGDRCEYCRMHQALQGATFHLEHILPTSRGRHPLRNPRPADD